MRILAFQKNKAAKLSCQYDFIGEKNQLLVLGNFLMKNDNLLQISVSDDREI